MTSPGASPEQDARAARCPLCGGANDCALAAHRREPCWCTRAVFAPELRARAALAEGALRCICAGCASGIGEVTVRGAR